MQQQIPITGASLAMAAGAVINTLLETLVAKGLLSRDEVRSLLVDAHNLLLTNPNQNALDATRIIDSVVAKFSDY
jgi:hypothetical protein